MSQLTSDVQFLDQWMSKQFQGFTVSTRRGYANFVAGFVIRDPSTDKELGNISPHHELLDLGIEPISVFTLGKGKNSVDMRIAMDMVASCISQAPVKRILLVSGDSDYLPVLLEVRRMGIEVLVVGFKGSKDKPRIVKYLPKFADHFWYFEDLVREQKDKISEQAHKGEPHSVGYYKLILQDQEPRYFIVPVREWNDITDAIFERFCEGVTQPESIVSYIRDHLGVGGSDTSVSVHLVVKQLFDSGCFTPVDPEAPRGETREREWDVRLDPEINTAQKMRIRVQEKIISTLRARLSRFGDTRDLKKEVIAELFFGQTPTPDEIKLVEHLIEVK